MQYVDGVLFKSATWPGGGGDVGCVIHTPLMFKSATWGCVGI